MRDIDELFSGKPLTTNTENTSTGTDIDSAPAEAGNAVDAGEKLVSDSAVLAKEGSPGAVDAKNQSHDDDDEAEAVVPDDFTKLRRALDAARGDKRRERKKHREIEARLSEVQGKLAAYERMIAQRPTANTPVAPVKIAPKIPDLTDDALYTKGSEAVKEYVNHLMGEANARIQESQAFARERFNRLSAASARQRHKDYDDIVQSCYDPAQNRFELPPEVIQRIEGSDDPAESLYQHVKAITQFKNFSSIDEFTAKMEADIRKKVEAELSEKYQSASATSPSNNGSKIPIPPSLAGARGSGAGKPTNWSGPRPLDDLFMT